MGKKIKFVKEVINKQFVYKIQNASVLTLDFISQKKWPDNARALLFLIEEGSKSDFEIIHKNLADKFFCRFFYGINNDDIKIPSANLDIKTIKRYKFKSKAELKRLYVETITSYFWNPWQKYLDKFYGKKQFFKETERQGEKDLLPENTLCLEKNNKPIALLSLSKSKQIFGLSGEQVDWVLWVWIDSSIKGEERKYVRYQFAKWLKKKTENLLTATEPFNSRANMFWIKLGLKLRCFGIKLTEK